MAERTHTGLTRRERQIMDILYRRGRATAAEVLEELPGDTHYSRKSALRHLIDTFFDGSAEKAVAALLGGEASRRDDEQLERIADLIAKARKDGQR